MDVHERRPLSVGEPNQFLSVLSEPLGFLSETANPRSRRDSIASFPASQIFHDVFSIARRDAFFFARHLVHKYSARTLREYGLIA